MENKITFNDFKTGIEEGFKLQDIVRVKRGLTYAERLSFIDDMLSACIINLDNSNMKKIDYINKDLIFTILFIRYYTNIDLSEVESLYEVYDYLTNNNKSNITILNLLKCLNNYTNLDLCDLESCIDEVLEQEIKVNNSIENVIKTLLGELINKIPNESQLTNLFSTLKDSVGSFDSDKLSSIGKLLDVSKGKK